MNTLFNQTNLQTAKVYIYKYWPFIYWGICSLLLTFYVIKGIKIPLFVDESVLLDYIKSPFEDIIFYKGAALLANNHIFNTLWFQFINQFFYLSEPAIRFTSWVAFVVFSIVIWLLTNRFIISYKHKILFSLTILFNYQLSDYFYLARGYAWSNTLVLFIIYIVLKYTTISKIKPISYFGIVFLVVLCMLSNFSYSYIGISIVIVCFLMISIQVKVYKAVELMFFALTTIAFFSCLYFYFLPIGKTIILNDPYIPSGKNFITDTLFSFASVSLPDLLSTPFYYLGLIGFWSTWMLYAIFLIIKNWRNIEEFLKIKSNVVGMIGFGWILLVFTNYFLNHTGFPLVRALSCMIPIIILWAFFWIEEHPGFSTFKFSIVFYILCFFSISKQFLNIKNTKFEYAIWNTDVNSRQIANDLAAKNHSIILKSTITLYWPVNFYLAQLNSKFIKNSKLPYQATQDQIDEAQYLLIDNGHYHLLPSCKNFDVIKIYKPSSTYLLKKRGIE